MLSLQKNSENMGNKEQESPKFMDPSSNATPNQNVSDRVRTSPRYASSASNNQSNTSTSSTTTSASEGVHSMYEGGEQPEENKRGGGIFSKILIGLLSLGIGGLGYYAYNLNKDKQRTETELNEQKQQIIKELDGLKTSYDRAVEENKETSKELIEARDKVTMYIDSLRTIKLSVAELAKYKSQVFTLRKERERLLSINDSLRKQNQLIRKQKDSISMALQNVTSYADSLANLTTKLKEVVETGEDLQISKLSADAVKVRSNGKLISTARAKAGDKIRLCFTVVANKIAPSGTKFFYIQLTAPNGEILGKNEAISVDKNKINYSVATKFIYANKNIDVCDFINKKGKTF